MEEDGSSPAQGGASHPAPSADQAPKKPRSQKTPLQKEVLEASFQLNPNPNEEHRRALGERIGLDEKQVQAWFVNRRRRDKRAEENRQIALAVQQKAAAEAAAQAATVAPSAASPAPAPPLPPTGSSSSPAPTMPAPPAPMPAAAPVPLPPPPAPPAPPLNSPALPMPPAAAMPLPVSAPALDSSAPSEAQLADYQALLQAAAASLPAGAAADAPPLGAVFDDLPNTQQGAGVKRKRVAMEAPTADAEPAGGHTGGSAAATAAATASAAHKPFQRPKTLDKAEREKLRAEEERLRELERAERERRKAMDRLDKERQKEEARRLRELEKQRIAQEREARKREAAAERERRAEDKRREKEGRKRDKEYGRTGEKGERPVGSRYRSVVLAPGPPDDEDIEMEALIQAQRRAAGLPPLPPGSTLLADGSAPANGTAPAGTPEPFLPRPERPPFPPPALHLTPAFDDTLAADDLGPDLLMVSGFLHTFSDVLGLRPTPTIDALAQAVVDGCHSPMLGAIHIGMMRLLQADMEEAHASGATASVGGPGTLIDRALVVAAHQLESAWGWGYDIDVWRAHTNVITWPEVLREMGLAMTLAPEKKAPRRSGRPGPAHARPKIGEAGEDLYEDQAGGLKLRLPARYAVGSVKAAAWQVLAECGTDGLTIAEIARRIQEAGLRDLRAARTPEASVAGALSRDMLFARIAPSTFALASVLQHYKRLGLPPPSARDEAAPAGVVKDATPDSKPPDPLGVVKPEPGVGVKPDPHGPGPMDTDGGTPGQRGGRAGSVKREETPRPGGEGTEGGGGSGGGQHAAGEEEEFSGDEEFDEFGNPVEAGAVAYSKETWVNTLAALDYDALTVRERLDALCWLVHSTLDGPTLRAVMDARAEDAVNIKKQMVEDAKNDKRRRQADAAAKARAAAEEASRRLEELQAAGGTLPGPGAPLAGPGAGAAPGLVDATAAAQMAMEAASVAAQRAAMAGSDDAEEERAARLRRLDAARRVEEEKAIRIDPVGADRRYHRYWHITAVITPSGASAIPEAPAEPGTAPDLPHDLDPSEGRLFVEGPQGASWQLMSRPEQVDLLARSLDTRGAREGGLATGLHTQGGRIKAAMPCQPVSLTAPPQPPTAPPRPPLAALWDQLFSLLRPCAAGLPVAQGDAASRQHPLAGLPSDPPRARKLKSDMATIATRLPASALVPNFDVGAWVGVVTTAATPLVLRRCLGQLEAAILPASLSAAFQRNPTVRRPAWSSPLRLQHEAELAAAASSDAAAPNHTALAEPLAWLPPTYAAVALRLAALDAAVFYPPGEKCGRDRLLGYKYITRPAPLLRTVDGGEPPWTAAQPQAPHLSTRLGGVAVALAQGITATGRPRHVLVFPLLPLHTLGAAPVDFSLPEINGLREEVAEAEADGTLAPDPTLAPPPPPVAGPGSATPGASPAASGGTGPGGAGRLAGGRAAAAKLDAALAARKRRAAAMARASASVRSAFARATQSRLGGGRDRDRLSRARGIKVRKVRQATAAREHERTRSEDGDEGGEEDGWDGGYDETGPGPMASEDPGDEDYDGGAPQEEEEEEEEDG